MKVENDRRGAVLDEAVLKCLKLKKKKNTLFLETRGCKETYREVPCTYPSSAPMLAFYAITVKYQNQESDIHAVHRAHSNFTSNTCPQLSMCA